MCIKEVYKHVHFFKKNRLFFTRIRSSKRWGNKKEGVRARKKTENDKETEMEEDRIREGERQTEGERR